MSKRERETTEFQFPTQKKDEIDQWIDDCAEFYAIKLHAIDYNLSARLLDDQLLNRKTKQGEPEKIIADKKSSLIAGLESLTLRVLCNQIILLGHFSKEIRALAANLVVKLADILAGTKISKSQLTTVLIGLLTNEHGYTESVQQLFQAVGKAFAIMVTPLITALEVYAVFPDWRHRVIANTAIAQLILENTEKVLEEDRLNSIWNVFFALGAIAGISPLFPDRIVVLKALHSLAKIYANVDAELTQYVIATLLKLNNKTVSEIVVIKGTLNILFEVTLRNASKLDIAVYRKYTHDYYSIFIELISSQDESVLDLLSWAIETFFNTENLVMNGKSFKTSQSQITSGEKDVPDQASDALRKFSMLLINHLKAPNASIRHGAALALLSIIILCPSFPVMNPHIWQFIVWGIFDIDHVVASIYLEISELIKVPNNIDLKNQIILIRNRMDIGGNRGGDERYTSIHLDKAKLAYLVARNAPPLGIEAIHKIINVIDYISKKKLLKNLEIIKIWGEKLDKTDGHLMKKLVHLVTNSDKTIQLKAISVLKVLFPAFMEDKPADIAFIWSYIERLIDPSLDSNVLVAMLDLLHVFPLKYLPKGPKFDALQKLFFLIFHSDSAVRLGVYKFIGSAMESWKKAELNEIVIAILILSFGDGNNGNIRVIIDTLSAIDDSSLTTIIGPLSKLRESLFSNNLAIIKAYDAVSTGIAMNKSEFKPTIDAMFVPERIDAFWDFFLGNVQDGQLARPEDYDYSKNLIQNPVWIALLCSKFNVPPPAIATEANTRRDQMPTTPLGKRRFIAGFMHCLFPNAGCWDPLIRQASCVTMICCCFKGNNIQGEMLRVLLEYVTQLFLTSKYTSYQLSAIDSLSILIILKIPGVSESLYFQFYGLCMELLNNTHSSLIQMSVLNLLESMILVFPKGMNTKLSEVRDITRSLLVHKDWAVRSAAQTFYPLIFKSVLPSQSKEFEDFLFDEIKLLENPASQEAKADPWICNLNCSQIKELLALNIYLLGLIPFNAETSFRIATSLMRYLADKRSQIRASALRAIIKLLQALEPDDSSTTLWVMLPLYADLNLEVRKIWSRFRRNVPSPFEKRFDIISSHPDDSTVLPLTSWEDILVDHSVLPVSPKFFADLTFSIEQWTMFIDDELPVEDDGFHLPTISEKLLERLKELISTLTTVLPTSSQEKVKYHLAFYKEHPHLSSIALLILAEFGCLHADNYDDTALQLLDSVSLDYNATYKMQIEAAVLGIRSIIVNSKSMSKELIDNLVKSEAPSTGELIAMIYSFEYLGELRQPVLIHLIDRLCEIIKTSRNSIEKRLLASYLAVEFVPKLSPDINKKVLHSIQTLVEDAQTPSDKEKIFQISGKLMKDNSDHPLFKSMATQAALFLKSKEVSIRYQALLIFQIFSKSLPRDELLNYLYYFLADSSEKIREQGKNIIIDQDLISFANDKLKKATIIEPGLKYDVTQKCRLPILNTVGIQINQHDSSAQNYKTDDTHTDPFNIQYFKSEKRKKLSKRYQINETAFERIIMPLTIGVLKQVEIRYTGLSAAEKALYFGENQYKNLQPMTILSILVGMAPEVASKIVIKILETLEGLLDFEKKQIEENGDIEVLAQKLEILSNMLVAHGQSGNAEAQNMVESLVVRLQNFIQSCCSLSAKIRDDLYREAEHNFYYCNQYAEIPIISEEQLAELQKLRDSTQEAILDVVKSGKTDKIDLIDNRNDQWDGEADSESDLLRKLTILSVHALSGLGLYFALTQSSDKIILKYLDYLFKSLEDEHRGLRLVVIDSATHWIQLFTSLQSRESLYENIHQKLAAIIKKLSTEHYTMFRKKADYVQLASQFMVYFSDHELEKELLGILLLFWRDADSEVRQISISMVKHLGEQGVAGVINGFGEYIEDDTEDASLNIMKEIVSLGNNEDYPDRDLLQNLLKWRYSVESTRNTPARDGPHSVRTESRPHTFLPSKTPASRPLGQDGSPGLDEI